MYEDDLYELALDLTWDEDFAASFSEDFGDEFE
jgi:hypothetical protein